VVFIIMRLAVLIIEKSTTLRKLQLLQKELESTYNIALTRLTNTRLTSMRAGKYVTFIRITRQKDGKYSPCLNHPQKVTEYTRDTSGKDLTYKAHR